VKKTILIFLISFLGSGCASMLSDSTQLIMVETPDCPAAQCKLSNSKGSYMVKETPETIPVNKAYGDLSISCSKDGNSEKNSVESSSTGLIWVNIIGPWLVGAAIDSATGKGFEYKERITNDLKCN